MRIVLTIVAANVVAFAWQFVVAWRADLAAQRDHAASFIRRADRALQATEYGPFAITSVKIEPSIRGGRVDVEWRGKNGTSAKAYEVL